MSKKVIFYEVILSLFSLLSAFVHVPIKQAHPESKLAFSKLLSSKFYNSIKDFLPLQKQSEPAIYNYMDTQFYGEISIGTPAQKFNVLFDNRSPFFWVASQNCFSIPCLRQETYKSGESSTYIANGKTFTNIDYVTITNEMEAEVHIFLSI